MLERRDIPLVLLFVSCGVIGWLWGQDVLTRSSAEYLGYVVCILGVVWLFVSGRMDDGFQLRRRRD
jgi:hypothetical protein